MKKIIEADGHVVEPRTLWLEYIELAFHDRVPQIAKDEEGIDRVEVEGRASRVALGSGVSWFRV